jgi:glycosyltransferase involved in cell wall biosynthesis
MTRTLVVTSTFPQHDGDFRGAFLRHHWEAACQRGEVVRVLAPHSRWVDGELPGPLELRRFRYAPHRLSSLTGHFGMLENLRETPMRAFLLPGFQAALTLALHREVREFRPDRVVAHFWLPSGAAVARACRGRIPYELFGHGTDVDLVLGAPTWLRERFRPFLEDAAALRLPSTRKLEKICDAFGWGPGDAVFERIGVEMMSHAIAVDPGDRPPMRTGPYLLFLGRLISQKGIPTLLEALARVENAPPLVIAGEGPERRSIEAGANRLGVEVQFTGWVSGDHKAAWIRDATALLVPSRQSHSLGEGAPLVLAEAHALGTPIVATDVGGVVELISELDADAEIVRPDDSTALAQAIERVMARTGPGRRLRAI